MTTIPPYGCLTRESLKRLASDDLPVSELMQLEEHIESCAHCRRILESTSTDAHWQQEVLPQLRRATSNSEAQETKEIKREDCAFQSVLDLLGPTDDPHKLGRIGNYEVVGVIGAGGMGVVLKAFDSALNRFVAIKMMSPLLATSGAARQRFQREGRAAAAVINDYVLPIYSVDQWQGVPYLVMQYSSGINLQKRIEADGPLGLSEILRIALQTSRGLAAAHAQALVHRDVKPSNILLDGGVGRAMLCDFGLARAVDDASITRTGTMTGTPLFMSPEQVRGDMVDARSDLFSLGTTMYAMCTGHSPFRSESTYGVLHRLLHDRPRPICELNPDIPAWLRTIIEKLMSKRVDDRYQSAQELAELLERCIAHVQQPESNPLPEEIGWPKPATVSRSLLKPLLRMAGSNMGKIVTIAFTGIVMVAAYLIQARMPREDFEWLQGEWVLISAERDGRETPKDELYNERLIIDGVRFSRHQTSPAGLAIKGESGEISRAADGRENSIDFMIRGKGTAYGIFKQEGEKLELCIAREGERPTSFVTTNGDTRMRQTFRRINPSMQKVPKDTPDVSRTWTREWMDKIPLALDVSKNSEAAMEWMRENGFQSVEAKPVNTEVLRRLCPEADDKALQSLQKSFGSYVHGLLAPPPEATYAGGIEVTCLFSSDGKFASLLVEPQSQPSAASSTNANAGKSKTVPVATACAVFAGHANWVKAVSFSPTGNTIASASRDGTVRVWDSQSGKVLHVLSANPGQKTGHTGYVEDVRYNPDGKTLVSAGSSEETIFVWSNNGHCISTLHAGGGSGVSQLAFSPDGSRLASAGANVRVYDTDLSANDIGGYISTFETQDASSVTFSPDGNRLATVGRDRKLHIWDAKTSSEVTSATDTEELYCVAYNPNGKQIATASMREVALRDCETGEIQRTLKGLTKNIRLAYSPDGKWLATAGWSNDVRIWDATSGIEVLALSGHGNTVWGLAFSNDGRRLATGSADRLVRVWDLSMLYENEEEKTPTR